MPHPTSTEAAKPNHGAWASWLAIAAVAIVLGLLLPQLMPGESAAETTSTKSDVKDKGKLEYTAPLLPEAPSVQGMFIRLGVGTAVVLGLCVMTLWGIKRWVNPAADNGSLPRAMQLRETLHLGNRCCLHLVHLGKQPILVGVDANGVKTIVPLTAPFDEVLAEAEAPPSDNGANPPQKLAA